MTLHLTKLGDEGFVRRQVNTLNLFNSVGSTIGMLFGSVILSLVHNLNDVLKLKLIFLIASIMLLVSSLLVMERQRRRIVVRPDIRATRILFTRIVDFTGEFFKFVRCKKFRQKYATYHNCRVCYFLWLKYRAFHLYRIPKRNV